MFSYQTLWLDKQEYSKVVSEINSNYALYRDKQIIAHHTLGIDNRYYVYYLENQGFNNYNIFERYEF